MKKKGLFLLIVVTVMALAAAWMAVTNQGSAKANPDERGLLFEDLDVNRVDKLVVEDSEGAVHLQRVEDGWGLADRGGYAVDFKKVKELVVKLADLEIREPKTRKKENHGQLGLQDPQEDDSTSKRITLEDENGEPLASLLVGNSAARRGSQTVFVRRDGEDQVYLCEGSFTVDSKPASWIEKDIVRLENDRVDRVMIEHANGEVVRLGRNPENPTQFTVENVPPDREERFPGVANSTGTALSYLGLEDVRPVEEVDFTAAPLARATYTTEDGLVLALEIATFEEKPWAKVSASYEAPAPTIGPVPETSETAEDVTEGDGAEAPEAAPEGDGPDSEAIRAEADELNLRLAAWAYQIPDYKAEHVGRKMEDLLDEAAEEEPLTEPVEDTLEGPAAEDALQQFKDESGNPGGVEGDGGGR